MGDNTTVVKPLPWYDGRENLSELVNFLDALSIYIEDFAYFLEKPWKWENEYKLMRKHPNWNNYDQVRMQELYELIMKDEFGEDWPDA